ncbi:hypothetical protein TNCV_3814231 [Trichonephila clavipes]|nr:hypothetical protein TNCV_3814231 [Trichonephila clavipes]
MGVCKCIVPSRHGVTLSNRRAASPLVMQVEGQRGRKSRTTPQGVLSQNWGVGWNRAKHSAICMVLKATDNDRRTPSPHHDELRGPRNDSVDQADRNSNKINWNNLKDLPMGPRRTTVAEFSLASGHDFLFKHLHQIHVVQVPFCSLYDIWEGEADRIRRCPALKGFSLCDLY